MYVMKKEEMVVENPEMRYVKQNWKRKIGLGKSLIKTVRREMKRDKVML